MNWLPFVSRRRYKAELATKQALLDEARTERDGARAGREQFRLEVLRLTRLLADGRAREKRLTGTVTAYANRDLDKTDEVIALERQVKHLQARLDDAVGLTTGGIKDSAPWQPAHTEPKPEVAGS